MRRTVVSAVGTVHPVVQSPRQPVDVVLGILHGKPGKENFFDIRDTVCIAVLEKENVRRTGDEDSPTPGQRRRWKLESVGKDCRCLVVAVPVQVLQQLHATRGP